jgi:predicted nucleic acid-binding protein
LNWLLDTNVVSQLVRRHPDTRVLSWLRRNSAFEDRFHLSAGSVGELRRGALMLPPDDARRSRILDWLTHEMPVRFGTRILAFDQAVASTWADMIASLPRGYNQPFLDSIIAATALHYDLTLVTRDIGDFRRVRSLKLENPFT